MKTRILKTKYCFFLVGIFIVLFLSSNEFHSAIGIVSEGSYITISVSEAKKLIENTTDLFILDVRTNSEFKDGHISGAYLIPHTDIIARQDELPKNKTKPILVYCRSGTRSAAANSTLDSLEYTHVNNMDGGFIAWKNSGYSYETGAFVKPVTKATSSSSTTSLITPSSSSAGLITPGFGIFLVFQAICIIFLRSKKRK